MTSRVERSFKGLHVKVLFSVEARVREEDIEAVENETHRRRREVEWFVEERG